MKEKKNEKTVENNNECQSIVSISYRIQSVLIQAIFVSVFDNRHTIFLSNQQTREKSVAKLNEKKNRHI